MTCSFCGADCSECSFNDKCKGCKESCGRPFGGDCIAAEYIHMGGRDAFEAFKKTIIEEFNTLDVEGMPEVGDLNLLAGFYVNLPYRMPSGETIKLLDDKKIYLGNQLCSLFDPEQCFGIVAGMDFLLVCTYGENGANPELICYKRR